MKASRLNSSHVSPFVRRLPIGAEIVSGGVHVRVWAPERRKVEIVLDSPRGAPATHALEAEEDGYFSGTVGDIGAGAQYRFRLDDGDALHADPASRFQPDGPHGPSMVVDPAAYRWRVDGWRGLGRKRQVIYEMHVGTFTPEGTWDAARGRLQHLAETGITVIEVMPAADFAGRFGWGYDGVNLFAPSRLYGQPDAMRAFIDAAHALKIGVILDVVYNHLGPDGNVLPFFSEHYFSRSHQTDWGDAINFDGPFSAPVRAFVLSNVRYWIDEFRLDGLRVDATQDMFDSSRPHILAEISGTARAAAPGRDILIIAENEPQQRQLVLPVEQGGHGFDMLWNDDFHHSATVKLTGRREAYYTDYRGAPQEFVSVARHGYLYQGQLYRWQGKRRGSATRGLDRAVFVNFLQNHDQIANSGRGLRIHALAGSGRCRAMTALLLLLPGTPMLFQGQEFAAAAPFFYFADHKPEIAALVRKGRAEFLSQFPSLATAEMQVMLPDPADPATFHRSKLDWSGVQDHREALALHRDLLTLRREDPVLKSIDDAALDGAVLAEDAFLLRYQAHDVGERLLLVNFGGDLQLEVAPEPLLAPPAHHVWTLLFSSEDPRYGGTGTPPMESEGGWHLPGRCALLAAAVDAPQGTSPGQP